MEDCYLSDNGADCNAEAAEEPGEAVDETGEEQDGAATQAKPARKRPVQNPRPKLNKDRLASARGIPELLHMSREVHWRGKGHELQDLDTALSVLEHWGHRLFPQMDSNNFFGQLEKLGMKREVQTYMRKLRMGLEDGGDMPAEPDDGMLLEEEREEEQPARLEEDPFSSLLATTSTTTTISSQATPNNDSEEMRQELRERMERSRLQALERRRLRLAQQGPAPSAEDSGHAELDSSEPHTSDCTSPRSSARESRGEPQKDEEPECLEPAP